MHHPCAHEIVGAGSRGNSAASALLYKLARSGTFQCRREHDPPVIPSSSASLDGHSGKGVAGESFTCPSRAKSKPLKIFYYQAPQGNFGDDLNGWLWEELAPGRWSGDESTLFCGIGTIIGNSLPTAATRIRVFSSGIGYRPVPADFTSTRWDVVALRGPLTAQPGGGPPFGSVTSSSAHFPLGGSLVVSGAIRFTITPGSLATDCSASHFLMGLGVSIWGYWMAYWR